MSHLSHTRAPLRAAVLLDDTWAMARSPNTVVPSHRDAVGAPGARPYGLIIGCP